MATYSLDTRWFTAVAATLMIAFISHLYGCAVIVPWFFIASLVIFLSVAVFKVTQTVLFNKDTLNELLNPEKTLNLFTIVVAVTFAGVCFSKVFHLHTTASILWYVSISLWLGISLFSFSILFLYHKSEDRKIEEIFHGGWFFATAGAQSTAFLGVIVAEHITRNVLFIQLFPFALWSICFMVYRGGFVSHLYGIDYHEINFLLVQEQYSAIALLDECRSGCVNGAYRFNIVSVYKYLGCPIRRFPPVSEGDFPVFLVSRVMVVAIPGSSGHQETGLQ